VPTLSRPAITRGAPADAGAPPNELRYPCAFGFATYFLPVTSL
jgi:hypothetical protein